jgi:diaminopimelate decarboxylase
VTTYDGRTTPLLPVGTGPAGAPEVWPLTATTVDGELHIGGVSMVQLAAACGTPLYVVDESDFRERARVWRDESGADQVHYASKAFLTSLMVRWVDSEQLHIDVCSLGELDTVTASGFDPTRIAMHGNNKSIAELTAAVQRGVGVVVLDCEEEISRLAAIAAAAGTIQDVYIRVAAGVTAQTHEFMATGSDDVKFGFPITDSHAEHAAVNVAAQPSLRLRGLHSHLGSQLLSTEGLRDAARRVGGLVETLEQRHRISIGNLDLGGGAGIAYLPGEQRMQPTEFVAALRAGLRDVLDPDTVKLAVEPGRSLIGTAGVTIYRVGVVKDGIRRRFVSVDGGISDALRPSLYGARYTAWVANRVTGPETTHSIVVGRHCESGDVVVPDLMLASDIAIGDLLAVPSTGAYHHAMANNYNFQPRPPVVSVCEGEARVMVRRETMADLVVRDNHGENLDLTSVPASLGDRRPEAVAT